MARKSLFFPKLFQSTLPVRGATVCEDTLNKWCKISIHAPRAGSDIKAAMPMSGEHKFQSTLPVRGATVEFDDNSAAVKISIHAPRAGSDPCHRR